MRPIPLIRASVALALAELLREVGAPADRLWERSRLPVVVPSEPERLVPLRSLTGFFEDAARDQGLDDLGIRLASRYGLGAIGQFGAAIRRAPTLHAALAAARDGVPGHNSAAQYWTVLEGDSVRFCRRFRDADRGFRQADLLTVALMVDVVRLVAGPGWRPRRIELQSRGEPPGQRYDAFAEAKVEACRPVTSITIPRLYLSASFPGPVAGKPSAPSFEGRLGPPPPAEFLPSLEVVVETLLGSRRLEIGTVALAAGASVRSLQRRLAELGVSYSEVVDRVRFRIASEMLLDEAVKVIDVGFAVGYSDPAHFTRAFRRWTSLSPIEYRRQRLHGEPARRSA